MQTTCCLCACIYRVRFVRDYSGLRRIKGSLFGESCRDRVQVVCQTCQLAMHCSQLKPRQQEGPKTRCLGSHFSASNSGFHGFMHP